MGFERIGFCAGIYPRRAVGNADRIFSGAVAGGWALWAGRSVASFEDVVAIVLEKV